MRLTRIKEDVTALSYELLRRNGLSVRFRVKTYYDTINKQNNYYYNEYIYNIGSKKRSSIVLCPRSYIQFDFGTDDGKNMFFLLEVHKNKFVRKLSQIIQLLEAYDCGEIDIIKVDSTGTHINSKFPKETKFSLGTNTAIVSVGIREEKMDIGVSIQFNDMKATISIHDFLDLMTKLAGINYTYMSMMLLNHIGPPELGSHEYDFRPERITSTVDRDTEIDSVVSSNNSLKELQTNNSNTKSLTRPKW